MSVISILFIAFCLWIFYNLFVKVIWPVYKTTSRLKKGFKDMAEQRQAQEKQTHTPPPNRKEKVGEYIEFEEIK